MLNMVRSFVIFHNGDMGKSVMVKMTGMYVIVFVEDEKLDDF